jgi:hypothetical protein
LNLQNDALGSGDQGVVEASVEGAIAGYRPTNANHRHDQRGGTENKERHLAAGARQQRLDPLAPEFVAERHGYFAFGASANR